MRRRLRPRQPLQHLTLALGHQQSRSRRTHNTSLPRRTTYLRDTPLGPSARRATRSPVRPARRVPVPTVLQRPRRIHRPRHHMCCARTDFVVTSGAPVDLRRPRRRHRSDLVVIAVGAHLDAPRRRLRGFWPISLTTLYKAPAVRRLAIRTAGTRGCPGRASCRNRGSRQRIPRSVAKVRACGLICWAANTPRPGPARCRG